MAVDENRRTGRFVAHLAGNPLAVVAVTFCIGAVGTVILVLLARGMDAVGVVSALATIWALALALVIYLLTARDTDKLLTHIDALQDQLSAVLDAPGPGAEVVDAEPADAQSAPPVSPVPSAETPTKTPDAEPAVRAGETPPGRPTDRPGSPVDRPGGPVDRQAPTLESGIAGRVPAEYLAALQRMMGVETADIERAWTPSPNGRGPWVVEDRDGERWSVFKSRTGRPTVIPLGNVERYRRMRQERVDRLSSQHGGNSHGQRPA